VRGQHVGAGAPRGGTASTVGELDADEQLGI
jgi:hypothetical protein